MSLLIPHETLTWQMTLDRHSGYSSWSLVDARGRRWGWTVNAGAFGWTSHTGDWGQAADLALVSPPISEEIEQHESLADAKAWIEEKVAMGWKTANRDGRAAQSETASGRQAWLDTYRNVR